MRGRLQLSEQLIGAVPAVLALDVVAEVTEVRLAEHGAQGAGELALGQLPPLAGRPGVVRGFGQQHAGGQVQQAAGAQLKRDRASPDQRGVEGGTGGLQPGVQPVEAMLPPRDVDAGHGDRRQDDDADPRGHQAVAAFPAIPAVGSTAA